MLSFLLSSFLFLFLYFFGWSSDWFYSVLSMFCMWTCITVLIYSNSDVFYWILRSLCSICYFSGYVRKVSRIGESPVPSSYHRNESTLEISASDTPTNTNNAGIQGTNHKKKGLGTRYFSAVSCLCVRDGEVSGGNNNSSMNGTEGAWFFDVCTLSVWFVRLYFSVMLNVIDWIYALRTYF